MKFESLFLLFIFVFALFLTHTFCFEEAKSNSDSFRKVLLELIFANVGRCRLIYAQIYICQKLWSVFVNVTLTSYKYKLEMFLTPSLLLAGLCHYLTDVYVC